MRTIVTTDGVPVRMAFRLWREILNEQFGEVQAQPLADVPFSGRIEAAQVGPVSLLCVQSNDWQIDTTSRTVRRNSDLKTISFSFRMEGEGRLSQNDQTARQGSGDLFVVGRGPMVHESHGSCRALSIVVPLDRLERMLGPARVFAPLLIPRTLPSAALARTFFDELTRVHDGMAPETAERMAGIGIDLLVAAVADSMAQETPKPLQGTVTVQRAKAYVEANLSDHTLDPPLLAAAMGVSLRRLQQLFHERGRHISDWIWSRRLEVAAQRLADPGHAHIAVGTLSYGCGFVNQTHFSRRFRDRFGVTPSDYRRAALGFKA